MTRVAKSWLITALIASSALAGCGSSSKSAGTPTSGSPTQASTAPGSGTTAPNVTPTTGGSRQATVNLTFTGAVQLNAVGTKVGQCFVQPGQQGQNGAVSLDISDTQYPGVGKYLALEGSLLATGRARLDIIKWADRAGTATFIQTDNNTALAVTGETPPKVIATFKNAKFRNSKNQTIVTVNGSIVCTG